MFTGVTLPFTVSEMLTGAMELIGLVAPFIIVAIALAFAPKFISFVKGAITGNGGKR